MFMYSSIHACLTMVFDVYLLNLTSGAQWNDREWLEVAGKTNSILPTLRNFLRKQGCFKRLGFSSLVFVNAIGIYRARGWSKKNEKRYAFECKIFSLSILIKSFQNLIFSSLHELARIWHVLWASLVLTFDRNPTQLKLYLVFIFYLI